MPIYLKPVKEKSQVKPGSSSLELSKLQKLAHALQIQLNKMTLTIRKLKSEKHSLEIEISRKNAEIKRMQGELQRISRGRRSEPDFGDI